MATAQHPIQHEANLTDPPHSGFREAFDEATQESLLDEDRLAWRCVSGVLISIVFAGMLLGIAAVLIAT